MTLPVEEQAPQPRRGRASHAVDPVAAPSASVDPPNATTSSVLPADREAGECRKLSPPSKEDEQLAAQISTPSFTALALVQLLQTLRHLNEKAGH